MSWLIDTNIISEIRKGPACDANVAAWWQQVEDRDLYLSVLTLGEIRRGIQMLRPRDPVRARRLEDWHASVTTAFGTRLLGIDPQIAEAWGRISALRTVPVTDALLAATAQIHGLILVTRNTADVEGLGVACLNPFAA